MYLMCVCMQTLYSLVQLPLALWNVDSSQELDEALTLSADHSQLRQQGRNTPGPPLYIISNNPVLLQKETQDRLARCRVQGLV